MKTLTLFAATALLAGAALAQGNNVNLAAPTVQRHALPPSNPADTEGAVQRGVRLGNPAQLINPVAPQRYGDGRQFVVAHDEALGVQPQERARTNPVALKFFSFSF
jgi:hypothetical protein